MTDRIVHYNGNQYHIWKRGPKWRINGRRTYCVNGFQGTYKGAGESHRDWPRKWFHARRDQAS